MASRFDIAYADLVPEHLSVTAYNDLTGTGAEITLLTLIEEWEDRFVSILGGMFEESANITLAKPQVVAFVIYGLHFRRSQTGKYTIPDTIKALYDAAVKWAETVGRELLGREGEVAAPGATAAAYDAPATKFSLTQLDNL